MTSHVVVDSLLGQRLPSVFMDRISRQAPVAVAQFWHATNRDGQTLAPVLRRWHDVYGPLGLEVLTVHTPRYAFESSPGYLRQAIVAQHFTWSIVDDQDHGLWDSVGNQYWPRTIVINRQGFVVGDSIGTQGLNDLEGLIRWQLASSARQFLPPPTIIDPHTHAPEFVPVSVIPDQSQTVTPTHLAPLVAVRYLFAGRELSAVLEPVGGPVILMVTMNGHPIAQAEQGADCVSETGRTVLQIDRPRRYQVVVTANYQAPNQVTLTAVNRECTVYELTARGCVC